MNATTVVTNESTWDMIWGAGPMVKGVLLLLFAMSVISWAIMYYKFRLLKRIEDETVEFSDVFWEKKDFKSIYPECKSYKVSPLPRLFEVGYRELVETAKREHRTTFDSHDIDRLKRILRKTATVETTLMERTITFLATTGNTAPFVGLFGTVWGIMGSFKEIGSTGAASLAVVAPGISEALIATAMGLFAAIPAVVGYNMIISKITRINSEMENFTSDLLNIVDKEAPEKGTGGGE